MSDPHIYLTWEAQTHIKERFGWDDERELAGGLFGWWDDNHVEVDAVVPNPTQTGTRNRVDVDIPYFLGQQRFRTDPADMEQETVFVGCIHSHPGGDGRASHHDLDVWSKNARMCWPWLYVGLIATGGDELWRGGFPSGERDWTEPPITGWIATRDDLWSAPILFEDREHYELRRDLRFRPRGSVHATLTT